MRNLATHAFNGVWYTRNFIILHFGHAHINYGTKVVNTSVQFLWKKTFYGTNLGTYCYKVFMAVIYEYLEYVRVFVPARPFQTSVMFVGRLWPFANMTLSWKGLPGTNTLAYYENL
jgi:hypothetical protein